MIFNRIQMLRNKPIRVARDHTDSYLYVQGPTIGELYEDDKLFLVSQILLMEEKELKDFLKMEDEKLNKLDLMTILLIQFEEKDILLEKFKKILLKLHLKNNKIFIDDQPLRISEVNKIKEILEIIMGQKTVSGQIEKNQKLSEEEKRLLALEEKIKAKKTEQAKPKENNKGEENALEDIIIAVIYEFGLNIENIMNMNYFTLIWYYSYTGKLHVYRINQHAISSGAVKTINTDYFTSLK